MSWTSSSISYLPEKLQVFTLCIRILMTLCWLCLVTISLMILPAIFLIATFISQILSERMSSSFSWCILNSRKDSLTT